MFTYGIKCNKKCLEVHISNCGGDWLWGGIFLCIFHEKVFMLYWSSFFSLLEQEEWAFSSWDKLAVPVPSRGGVGGGSGPLRVQD